MKGKLVTENKALTQYLKSGKLSHQTIKHLKRSKNYRIFKALSLSQPHVPVQSRNLGSLIGNSTQGHNPIQPKEKLQSLSLRSDLTWAGGLGQCKAESCV